MTKQNGWTSYNITMLVVSLAMLGVGAWGVIYKVGNTMKDLQKDTDEKVKAQREDTEKKMKAQREDTKRLILALDDKLLMSDMTGKTIEEALVKSEEAGLDTRGVKIDSLPLSEVSQVLAKKGLTYMSSSDTAVKFLNPITGDTIILKLGRIFDQEPKAGTIAKKGAKVAVRLLEKIEEGDINRAKKEHP